MTPPPPNSVVVLLRAGQPNHRDEALLQHQSHLAEVGRQGLLGGRLLPHQHQGVGCGA